MLGNSRIRVKFGTAGIRGLYGQEVFLRETLAVCFGVQKMLGQGRFGVGYDTRRSSAILALLVCSAMNWYGSDVESYGIIPTPVLAFSIKNNKLHAGFSVTASHNPPEYAGIKVYGTDGIEFSLEAEHKLEELIQESSEYTKRSAGEELGFGSTYDNEESPSKYVDSLCKSVRGTKKELKILVDCANGTATDVTPRILSALGHKVVTVNSHQSSVFPGRPPEPTPESLGETAELCRRMGVDFALAHDGDADRLVMIDGGGAVLPDYVVSCLLLKIILESGRKGTVILSMNSSNALEEVAKDHGCRIYRSRLGKTFEELYKQRGIFATEPSKAVDPRWGYWEDGIYAAVLVTQYLSEDGRNLGEVVSSFPRYYNLQENVSMEGLLEYSEVASRLQEHLRESVGSIDLRDGVKVSLKDGSWLMLRRSGTEKKARVYVESREKGKAHELLALGRSVLAWKAVDV